LRVEFLRMVNEKISVILKQGYIELCYIVKTGKRRKKECYYRTKKIMTDLNQERVQL
jgi:hypothetical protein